MDERAEAPQKEARGPKTGFTLLASLIGGLLGGGGADALLHWLEFYNHIGEAQQQQILDVVKLSNDLESERGVSAADYIIVLDAGGVIPKTIKHKLVEVVARNASGDALARLATAFPEVVSSSDAIKATIAPGQPRVFVQIAERQQQQVASQIVEKLKTSGATGNVGFPGIQLVSKYEGLTEFRYFFKDDLNQANVIFSQIRRYVPAITCTRVPGYENNPNVHSALFEIWFPPGKIDARIEQPNAAINEPGCH